MSDKKIETYEMAIKEILRLNKEIERLNNIINELEIDSISGYYKPKSNDSDYLEGYDDGASLTAKFFHEQIKKLRGE